VIDHMAVMRRQIEEMQERALEGRSISKDLLAEVLAAVVESSSRDEERVDNRELGAAEPGNASPDYEPPGSPEYIPPQDDMETEVSETPQSFKCSLCGFTVSQAHAGGEEVIYQLYMHLEEEHGMDDAEEEELEKCCIPIGSKEDEVGAKESSADASKKCEEGLEAQLENGVETSSKKVVGGAEMDKEMDTDKEKMIGNEERKAGENEQEAEVNGQEVDNAAVTKQKGDIEEQQVDLKEEQVDLKKLEFNIKEQVVDQEQEKDISLEESKEEQDASAKYDTIGESQEEDKDVDRAPSSSTSVASGVVTTMEELQEALAKTGDHKFIASEELTNSPEYKALMENSEASS